MLMGALPVWPTNAFYNPWKADLMCGTKISEPITLKGVERKEGLGSGSHRRALFRAISAFVSMIHNKCPLYPRKAWHFDLRRYPGSRPG